MNKLTKMLSIAAADGWDGLRNTENKKKDKHEQKKNNKKTNINNEYQFLTTTSMTFRLGFQHRNPV